MTLGVWLPSLISATLPVEHLPGVVSIFISASGQNLARIWAFCEVIEGCVASDPLQTECSLLVLSPPLSESIEHDCQQHNANTSCQPFTHVGKVHCIENLFAKY